MITAVLLKRGCINKNQKKAIEPTVEALEDADPDYLVPCHCTGWRAINTIIQRMPEKFIQPSVGTKFVFEA